MSTTVAAGSLTVTSTSESAEAMSAALSGEPEKDKTPRVLVNKGVPVEDEPKDEVSEAASKLGKKGGEAAAKARKAAEKGKEAPETQETPEGDTEPEKEPEAPPVEKDRRGDPRFDPKAKVAEVTLKMAEERKARQAAEDRARAAEAKLWAAEQARTGQPAQTTRDGQERREAPQQGAQASERPKEEDFESYADFVDALTDWKVDQRDQKRQREYEAHQLAARHAAHIDGMVKGWNGTLAKAAAADPEFMDYVAPALAEIGLPSRLLPEGERPDGRNWIADDLISAPDRAPDLLRYLTEHPDEHQRIAALSSPRAITRELAILGRSAAATAGTGAAREVSKAHPPVRPVTGTPHTADSELDENAPVSAFAARWNQRELKNSRR